jgi:hypothetical protein
LPPEAAPRLARFEPAPRLPEGLHSGIWCPGTGRVSALRLCRLAYQDSHSSSRPRTTRFPRSGPCHAVTTVA